MFKVWDALGHRATMDIDLLANTSNRLEHLQSLIKEVSEIECKEDAVFFDMSKLILRRTQTTGDYAGISFSFSAKLYTTKVPILIDVGFNDKVIPNPNEVIYPTLLEMPRPILLGYTIETAFAEKLESIVKLGLVNTRMKDFYDLWTMIENYNIDSDRLKTAIEEVFSNRGTPFKYPIAFTPEYYKKVETQKRWNNFLTLIGKEHIPFERVISEVSAFTSNLIDDWL